VLDERVEVDIQTAKREFTVQGMCIHFKPLLGSIGIVVMATLFSLAMGTVMRMPGIRGVGINSLALVVAAVGMDWIW
jgi:hypothetical protein